MSGRYKEAARVYGSVSRGHGGLKSLTFNDKVKHKGFTYALVCETLKHKQLIERILKKCNVSLSKLGRDENLVMIMLFDLLFGKKGIQGGGAVKRSIVAHETQFREVLAKLVESEGKKGLAGLLPEGYQNAAKLRRFARVNSILAPSVSEVLESLKADFPTVTVDPTIPCLLSFPPKTDLHAHELVLSSQLILQDKASCFPVQALKECLESYGAVCEGVVEKRSVTTVDVIDACAAPGNKTSQIAAVVKESGGKVFAFDKSKPRLELLTKRMKAAGATHVEPILLDFLKSDPTDDQFSQVQAMVVDPSCSGSGMAARADHLLTDDNTNDPARIKKLADFQVSCLQHAFSFASVNWVVYSTCSVHVEENEGVVQRVLESSGEFELVHALESWKRRGFVDGPLSAEQAQKVVRADPKEDETIGFFVALFQRKTVTASGRTKKRPRDGEEEKKSKKKRKKVTTEAGAKKRNAKKREQRSKKKELKRQEDADAAASRAAQE